MLIYLTDKGLIQMKTVIFEKLPWQILGIVLINLDIKGKIIFLNSFPKKFSQEKKSLSELVFCNKKMILDYSGLWKKLADIYSKLSPRMLQLIDAAARGEVQNFMAKKPNHDEIYGIGDIKKPGLLEWSYQHNQKTILDFLFNLLTNCWGKISEFPDIWSMAKIETLSANRFNFMIAIVCGRVQDSMDSFEKAKFTLEKALCVAARSGKMILVKACLDLRVPVDTTCTGICEFDGATPLHLAIKYGHLNIVKFLIEKGADVTRCDYERRSPLLLAMWFNQREIFNHLQSPPSVYRF